MPQALEDKKRLYRQIFFLLQENPRMTISSIAKKVRAKPASVGNWLNDAFDQGFITTPQIRKKSFQNFPEYMYIAKCEDPLELFLQYTEDQNILCHARMEGSANIWVISRKKINIEGDILVSGLITENMRIC